MTNRSVILVDFDNVFSTLWDLDRGAAERFGGDPSEWLQRLGVSQIGGDARRWLVARCYLNPNGWVSSPGEPRDRLYFSRYRTGLVRAGFDVVDCPSVSSTGKNAADIRIVIDAIDLLDHRTRFDEFVIASGDSDFTPLLQRLRAEDRSTTVVSPGFLAAAYSASADQVVDYDGLRQLLQPSSGDPEEGCDASGGVQAADDVHSGFARFIRRRYAEASGPLALAALAVEADRAVPGVRAGGWAGHGGFARAVVALDLSHARLSQHHLWDEERHQPPEDGTDADVGLPPTVALLTRSIDLPRLRRDDWSRVFAVIARYAGSHTFNLTEATRWCRDELAANGGGVARVSIGYVIRGLQFGGLRLDVAATPALTSSDVGGAFLASVLDRAASLGLTLDDDAERTVAEWFGLDV